MSRLTFKYDLNKDTDNFIRGTDSINNKKSTKLTEEYMALYGSDFSTDMVSQFLREKGQNLDFEQKMIQIKVEWEPLEEIFSKRCENLFEIQIPDEVVGYISLNQRCTYKWRENYFFIWYSSTNPRTKIMHELLHFYTHRKYDSLSIDATKFNDIKEALTVLLNTDFADLMNGVEDTGYPQHQDMRKRISELRTQSKPIDEIFRILAS